MYQLLLVPHGDILKIQLCGSSIRETCQAYKNYKNEMCSSSFEKNLIIIFILWLYVFSSSPKQKIISPQIVFFDPWMFIPQSPNRLSKNLKTKKHILVFIIVFCLKRSMHNFVYYYEYFDVAFGRFGVKFY